MKWFYLCKMGFQAAFFPKNKLFILNKNLIFKKLIFLVEPTTEPTMFKPFIFSKNGRYYARFYIPKQIRELIDRRYLFYNLFTSDESIARYNAAHIEQKVKEKMMIFEKMEKNDRNSITFNNIFFGSAGVQPEHGASTNQTNDSVIQILNLLQSMLKQDSAPIQTQQAAMTGSTPLQTAFDKFLMMKDKQSKITKNIYQNNINNYLEFFFSQKKGTEVCFINDIKHQDMSDFRDFLIEKLKNSSRTVDGKIDFFKALFKFAISENIMNHNPTEKLKSLLTRKQHKDEMHGIFDLHQLKTLYSNDHFVKSQTKDHDYFAGILLLTVTACRPGEIQNIRYNQFGFTTENKIPFLDIYSSKTKSRREVPIPQVVFDYLDKHYQISQNLNSDKQLLKYNKNGNAMGKKFATTQKKSNIFFDKNQKKLVTHSIRKFVNDHIRKNGVPLEIREQLLGHSEDGSINRSIYSNRFSVEQMHDTIKKHIDFILNETGLMSKITS